MKKRLLLLLCVPLMFSCGEKNEENVQKEEKLQTIDTTFSNGDRYVGEWKDNKMHGQGTCTYASGGKYIGKWKDNKRHGQGTYTAAKGKVYEGLWGNNELIGEE